MLNSSNVGNLGREMTFIHESLKKTYIKLKLPLETHVWIPWLNLDKNTCCLKLPALSQVIYIYGIDWT